MIYNLSRFLIKQQRIRLYWVLCVPRRTRHIDQSVSTMDSPDTDWACHFKCNHNYNRIPLPVILLSSLAFPPPSRSSLESVSSIQSLARSLHPDISFRPFFLLPSSYPILFAHLSARVIHCSYRHLTYSILCIYIVLLHRTVTVCGFPQVSNGPASPPHPWPPPPKPTSFRYIYQIPPSTTSRYTPVVYSLTLNKRLSLIVGPMVYLSLALLATSTISPLYRD